MELALCQRYLPAFTLTPVSLNYIGQVLSTTTVVVPIPFHTQARVAPTGITTTGLIQATDSGGGRTGTTNTFNSGSVHWGSITVSGGSGLVAGNASSLNPASTVLLYFTGCEL